MSLFSVLRFRNQPVATEQPAPHGDLDEFFAALSCAAERVENFSYRFGEPADPVGFVQLWGTGEHWIQIHRLWSRYPNCGHGSRMLQTVCSVADEHDIGIRLKVIPIGQKPYPLPRPQLKAWYERFGFTGKRWHLQRLPREGEKCEAVTLCGSNDRRW